MLSSNKWIGSRSSRPHSVHRLFCLPYAGGGVSMYTSWGMDTQARAASWPQIDICPIRLPGRESRLNEAPFTDHLSLLDALVPALIPHLDRPSSLFGHSMGALLAFELARRLQKMGKPVRYLFVSGHRAPQLPDPNPVVHHLPEAEFIGKVRRLNGIPDEVAANAELMRLVLPVLRADFRLSETYEYEPDRPLQCPIAVYGGIDDPYVSRDELAAWREQTEATCTLRLFPGDHFYLLNKPVAPLFSYIANTLQQHMEIGRRGEG